MSGKNVTCPECGEVLTTVKNHIKKHILKHYRVNIDNVYEITNPIIKKRIDFLVGAITEEEF